MGVSRSQKRGRQTQRCVDTIPMMIAQCPSLYTVGRAKPIQTQITVRELINVICLFTFLFVSEGGAK